MPKKGYVYLIQAGGHDCKIPTTLRDGGGAPRRARGRVPPRHAWGLLALQGRVISGQGPSFGRPAPVVRTYQDTVGVARA
jgi:hypothetical protein